MPVIIRKSDLQPLTREHFAHGALIGCLQSYNAFVEGERIEVHAGLRPKGTTFDVGKQFEPQDSRKYCLHQVFTEVHRTCGELTWIKVNLEGEQLLIEAVRLPDYTVVREIGRFPL